MPFLVSLSNAIGRCLPALVMLGALKMRTLSRLIRKPERPNSRPRETRNWSSRFIVWVPWLKCSVPVSAAPDSGAMQLNK